jgi:hypothetical protein
MPNYRYTLIVLDVCNNDAEARDQARRIADQYDGNCELGMVERIDSDTDTLGTDDEIAVDITDA